MEKNFGCLPPSTDIRDYKLAKAAADIDLPKAYQVDFLPKVKNQLRVSSCVAHTASSILEYHNKGNNNLSTNFIYGIQKSLCGHEGQGMHLRDACKIISKYGDMLENDCPGNDEVPECWPKAEKALSNKENLNKAAKFKISLYFNCKNNEEIKRAIYKYGPVLASVKWYTNFVCKNGVLEGQKSGNYNYHAIMIYGWNEEGFLCQNSWGNFWGDKGRFILPYSIPVAEAKGIVDAPDEEVVVTKQNNIIDFISKVVNFLINLYKNVKNNK